MSEKEKGSDKIKVLAENKKAKYEYFILETYEAGVALQGTEVKSIKEGWFNISDSYAKFDNGEMFLVNMHIKPYKFGNINNHDPLRKRKLLLHKRELRKLKIAITEKGLTFVPIQIYLKKGLVKIKLGICRGKKLYDKREVAKKKETEREMDKAIKKYT